MNCFRDNANFDRREVEAALAKILGGAEFQKNANSANFLKFVVEETLDGRGDRLKGFTIATSALGRSSSFDAQTSSAVRVQANRLRHLLEDYYHGSGSHDSVRIVLPLGSYQPRFERRRAAEPVARPIDPPKTNRSPRALRGASLSRIAGIAAVACLVIASAALLIWLSHGPYERAKNAVDPALSLGRPIIIVESANDADATKDAKDIAELAVVAIASKLSAVDHFVVKRRAESKSSEQTDYVLSIRAGPSGGTINDFTFELVHRPTNEIVWSRIVPGVNIGYAAAIKDMIWTVVRAVGDVFAGAVIADQRRRAATSSGPPRNYFCMAEAYDYVVSRSLAKRGPARECVDHQLSVNPQDSRALTLLSTILYYDYVDLMPGNKGLEDVERMEALAQRAFEIAPHRVETSSLLFLSQFAAERFDDAFGIAHELLEEVTDSRLPAAIIGAAHVARGRYDEGMALLSRLEDANMAMPNFAVPMLALAAYMRGDETTAERFARRAAAARYSMGLVMRIVVCGREKNEACVLEASQQLRRDYPGFAADVPTAFFRHALADDIKSRLLADLRAAGFFGEAPG